jgi:hypothetical protein
MWSQMGKWVIQDLGMESHNKTVSFESHAITIMKIQDQSWTPAECKNVWI